MAADLRARERGGDDHWRRRTRGIRAGAGETRIGSKEAGRTVEQAAAELVDYLSFVDEAPLPGPIAGTSGFAKQFQAQGPRDSRGRSLRDLHLTDRMFAYPCSYLIYSDGFDALPEEAKSAVYARMWEILSGAEDDERYTRLTVADRRAIVEILRDTKEGLPEYFMAGAEPAPTTP